MEGYNIKISSFLAIAIALFALTMIINAAEEKKTITGAEALQKLMDGNARFVSGNATHPNQSADRRTELVAGQHPFAIVVGCSDSRIAPEVAFDQGLGDVFVVRTAGQVIDNASLGSIEYGVEHLGVPLIVVLGHDSCGAVKATVEGGKPAGHLDSLVNFIQPAVDKAKASGNESEIVDLAIDNNIENIVEQLSTSQPILSEKVEKGELIIIGARYHLDDGSVDVME